MEIKYLNAELYSTNICFWIWCKKVFFNIQSAPDMFPFVHLDKVDRTKEVGRHHRVPTSNVSLNFRSWRPRRHQETKTSDCCTFVHATRPFLISLCENSLLLFSMNSLFSTFSNAYILIILPKFPPSPDSPELIPAAPQRPKYFLT